MIGKYAIFFLLAFVTVQGAHIGFQSVDHYYEKQAVYDIWDAIKDIIEKIKNAIGNLGENIQQIFKKIQDKINEIIAGLNLNEVIEKIIQKIKDIVGNLGGNVTACIDEQRPAIEALAEESQAASLQCVQAAQEKLVVITDKVQDLITKSAALKDDVIHRATKCIKDNIMHPINIIPCFKEQAAIVAQEITDLKDAALALVSEAQEVATQTATELANCMSAVAETTNAKQSVIIDNIQKCISAS